MHFEIKAQHFFVFSLPSLTITLIAAIQCYVILAGMKKLTYKRVAVAVVIAWSYGVFVWMISTVGYIYTRSQSCKLTSTNSTVDERIDIIGTIFNTLDGLFIDIPCFVIISVMTITSCSCFYKKVLNPSTSVQRKMLLLPILMIGFFLFTTILSRSLIPLIPLFRQRLGFLTALGTLIRLISQSNSFLFAALFLGLQKNFREVVVRMLKSAREKLSCKNVRVLPVESVTGGDTSRSAVVTIISA